MDDVIFEDVSEDFDLTKPFDRITLRLPVFCDWVEFKGETVFVMVNYQVTLKAKKPMMDISYCATQALNGIVLKTVQWDKNKFKPSRLARDTGWGLKP